MMRRVRCRLFGHRWAPARAGTLMVIPDGPGLVMPWVPVEPNESRGMGCLRCGRYEEHEWVNIARLVSRREP